MHPFRGKARKPSRVRHQHTHTNKDAHAHKDSAKCVVCHVCMCVCVSLQAVKAYSGSASATHADAVGSIMKEALQIMGVGLPCRWACIPLHACRQASWSPLCMCGALQVHACMLHLYLATSSHIRMLRVRCVPCVCVCVCVTGVCVRP